MRIKKQNSVALKRATARAAAISSIDPALELGEGLGLVTYRAAIERTREKLDRYNQLLSQLDEARMELQEAEALVQNFSKRMLAGVMAKYGSNSPEYEKDGGTRDSERRRPRKAAVVATQPAMDAAA